jgi:polar amino acid transport system substrate-binding protein
MRIQKIAGFAALALSLLAGNAYAQTDTLARIQQTKKIRIAIDLSVPPWSYKNDKLEMAGSEVETAQLLSHDLGAELELVPTNSANRIPLLVTNRTDLVISALTITPERLKTIDFSIPYSGISTFVAAPKSLVIKTPADLSGKRIAVTRGTTNDADITRMAPKDAEIVRFEDEATTMTAIVSNQMDTAALATTLINIINQRNPGKQMETKLLLQSSLFGFGMRKQETRLKEWVDAWILANLKNGKLQAIYKKNQNAEVPADVLKQIQ